MRSALSHKPPPLPQPTPPQFRETTYSKQCPSRGCSEKLTKLTKSSQKVPAQVVFLPCPSPPHPRTFRHAFRWGTIHCKVEFASFVWVECYALGCLYSYCPLLLWPCQASLCQQRAAGHLLLGPLQHSLSILVPYCLHDPCLWEAQLFLQEGLLGAMPAVEDMVAFDDLLCWTIALGALPFGFLGRSGDMRKKEWKLLLTLILTTTIWPPVITGTLPLQNASL